MLKIVFGRARPRLIDQFGAHHFDPLTFGYLNASFPSGHATTVGAIVGILMVWYPRWSLLIVELGLFFAATRIAAEAHYPSDVVAGFLLGRSSRSAWRAGWPGAACCSGSLPGKILPAAGGGAPRKSLPSAVVGAGNSQARPVAGKVASPIVWRHWSSKGIRT